MDPEGAALAFAAGEAAMYLQGPWALSELVKANPAMGSGAMTGVTYIQRVALKGGVAPATVCSPANKGTKEIVKYQADYIFWKAN